MNGSVAVLLAVFAASASFAEHPPDVTADNPADGRPVDLATSPRLRLVRDTHSLISQMALPDSFTATLSDARPVSVTVDDDSSETNPPAKPSLFDTMPDRGASKFPATISPLSLDELYGPPSVPFGVADVTYGTTSSADDQLAELIRRYLSGRGAAQAVAVSSAADSLAPSTQYQQPASQNTLQAAPVVATIQPPGLASSYNAPPAVQDPLPSYSAPQANTPQIQTVTVTHVSNPVTSYVVQPPAAAPVTTVAAAPPVQSYTRPQAAPVVTYTLAAAAPPAQAAPVHTYGPTASQPAVFVQQQQPQQQQQRQVQQQVQQPSVILPAPVGPFLLQTPAAAAPAAHSYSTPVQNPLFTPQLAYVSPYGAMSRQRDDDRDRDDDSGLVINLGGASIQLGGRSGTSIRLDGGRSDRQRDSGGSSITIIAGGSAARDPPAPIGPPAPAPGRSYSAPRDPPASYSAPRDPPRDPPSSYSPPVRDPPSSYSPPRDPPRDPPSSYSPPLRDPPSSYAPPVRDPPSSYSPPRDPPSSYSPPVMDPPSSYAPPRDPPSSYGGSQSDDQTNWRPIGNDRPSADDVEDDDDADNDSYTSYEGQTRRFPPSDAAVGRTGYRDTMRDPPAPVPPPRTYGAPPRDPPSPMYGAPPARDPPSSSYGAPPARDPPSSSYGAPPARDPPAPPPMTYGAPPARDPPSSMYGAPPARDPPSSSYGAPPADPPRDPPSSSYGAPARDPPAAAPTVLATPVQLLQAVPVVAFNPRPPPRPRPKPKHHYRKRPSPPRGRLVKDTIIREVSRPVRQRAPPFPGPPPAAAPQLFLATVPQNTQTLTLSVPVQNPPANPSTSYGAPPAADPPSMYGTPQRNPSGRSARPVGVVRDTLVREVLYDQFSKDYAKLFYKGALLIGALALLPAAAVAPLAAGRRRRSLFDAEPAAGAELPPALRRRLGAALPELAQLDTSECLQRELCRALRSVEASPYRDSFLLYYAVLSPDVNENPWMQQALTAARKSNCFDFYCNALPADSAGNHTVNATANAKSHAGATAHSATSHSATSNSPTVTGVISHSISARKGAIGANVNNYTSYNVVDFSRKPATKHLSTTFTGDGGDG